MWYPTTVPIYIYDMNILAVLVAAAAMFVIGFLWHGPLFGKTWMRLAGVAMPDPQPTFSSMVPQMIWNYIANVVIAGVFAAMVSFIGSLVPDPSFFDWSRGSIFAGWIWFGFVMPISSYGVIWMKQSKKLWLFELSSQLASFLAMGAIIGAWH